MSLIVRIGFFWLLVYNCLVNCTDPKNRNHHNKGDDINLNTLRGSCQQYGHSCLGGHGKRISNGPLINLIGLSSSSSSLEEEYKNYPINNNHNNLIKSIPFSSQPTIIHGSYNTNPYLNPLENQGKYHYGPVNYYDEINSQS